MKEFFKKYKKKLLQAAIIISALVLIGVAIYFILDYFKVTDVERLQELVKSCGAWAWIVFLLLQILVSLLLCFVPASNMTFITVGVLCFGANWQTFLLCFSGVLISSVLMDLMGRFGLKKLFEKIIGEEDMIKAEQLLNKYGKAYIPLFYLFPLFPDDAICCVAGSIKVNFWYHLASIIICRGIGVATIVFGISILPEEVITFTSTNIWDYVEVVTIIAFWVIVAFYLATKANKYFEKLKSKRDEKERLKAKGEEESQKIVEIEEENDEEDDEDEL